MELIRISKEKIKISLTKAELDAYDLTVESMDYGHKRTQKAFRELFVEAKEQTGFETDGEKVFVQIFRARDGGCEIFISKIEQRSEPETRKKPKNKEELYAFSSLGEMLLLCAGLVRLGYAERSSAYVSNGVFYILFSGLNEIQAALALEYGRRREDRSRAYINEHFSLIRKNDAVQMLSSLR